MRRVMFVLAMVLLFAMNLWAAADSTSAASRYDGVGRPRLVQVSRRHRYHAHRHGHHHQSHVRHSRGHRSA